MIYNYKCTEQKISSEVNDEYSAYGIVLEDNVILNDVTCDKVFADEIVGKLNEFQASPIHVPEIVENLIIQKYS